MNSQATRHLVSRIFSTIIGFLLILVPLISPTAMADAVAPSFPHLFWGYVTTTTGNPVPGMLVTAWINSELHGSISTPTDGSGKFGIESPPNDIPYYLIVNGKSGDVIEFRVNGVVAQSTGLAELADGHTKWQWHDLNPEEPVVFEIDIDGSRVNGIRLVYTQPIKQDTTPPDTPHVKKRMNVVLIVGIVIGLLAVSIGALILLRVKHKA